LIKHGILVRTCYRDRKSCEFWEQQLMRTNFFVLCSISNVLMMCDSNGGKLA
jgi:hypothetical protein